MSLSSASAKPVTEEPSKPFPCSRASSSSLSVIDTHFRIPKISTNHNCMEFILYFFTVSRISLFASLSVLAAGIDSLVEVSFFLSNVCPGVILSLGMIYCLPARSALIRPRFIRSITACRDIPSILATSVGLKYSLCICSSFRLVVHICTYIKQINANL